MDLRVSVGAFKGTKPRQVVPCRRIVARGTLAQEQVNHFDPNLHQGCPWCDAPAQGLPAFWREYS
eukprot:2200380-Alexandrium_andersonii.AAC.1